jgi:hypothetical protein
MPYLSQLPITKKLKKFNKQSLINDSKVYECLIRNKSEYLENESSRIRRLSKLRLLN